MGGHADVGGVGEGDMDTIVCAVGCAIGMAFSYADGVEASLCMCPLVNAVVYCFVVGFCAYQFGRESIENRNSRSGSVPYGRVDE